LLITDLAPSMEEEEYWLNQSRCHFHYGLRCAHGSITITASTTTTTSV